MTRCSSCVGAPSSFFFNDTATTEIYTLSLHDALPILRFHAGLRKLRELLQAGAIGRLLLVRAEVGQYLPTWRPGQRSEEHTSELQSRQYLVCRLLLEKKKNSQGSTSVSSSLTCAPTAS